MKIIIVLLLSASVCMLLPHTMGSMDGYDYYDSDEYGYDYSAGTPAPVPAVSPSSSAKSYISKQKIKSIIDTGRTAFRRANTSPGEILNNMFMMFPKPFATAGIAVQNIEAVITSPHGLNIQITFKTYCDIFDSVFGYNKDAHAVVNKQHVLVKGAEIRRVALVLLGDKSTRITVNYQSGKSIEFPISLSSLSKTMILSEDVVKLLNPRNMKKIMEGNKKYEDYFYEQMNNASLASMFEKKVGSIHSMPIESYKDFMDIFTLSMDLFDIDFLTTTLTAIKKGKVINLMQTVGSTIDHSKIMSFISSGPVLKVVLRSEGLMGMMNVGGGIIPGNPAEGGGVGELGGLAGTLGSGGIGSLADLSNLGSLLGKGTGGGTSGGLGALASQKTDDGGSGGANDLGALLGGSLGSSDSTGGLDALLGGSSGSADSAGAFLDGSSGSADRAGDLAALLSGSSKSPGGASGLGAVVGGSSGSGGTSGALLGGDAHDLGSEKTTGSHTGGFSGRVGGWGSLMRGMIGGTTGISSGKLGVVEELVAKIKEDAIKEYQQELIGFRIYQRTDPLANVSSCFCVAKNPQDI